MPLTTPDTRPLFRPLSAEVAGVLHALSPADWERPTLAPAWRVRDVVAHMIDTGLRRLSYHRDGTPPPSPLQPITSERELTAFINDLNASWIRVAARLSPRALIDLYTIVSGWLSDFIEALPDDEPALFPVSWAGSSGSAGLLDIGREFTEVWHHGAQVRDAVRAGPFSDPGWLRAVLEVSAHALPHAYREIRARTGASLVIEITGSAGGEWTLAREPARWDISRGSIENPTARATMTDDTAWRLFFNALTAQGESAVRVAGDVELVRPLFRVRAVIV